MHGANIHWMVSCVFLAYTYCVLLAELEGGGGWLVGRGVSEVYQDLLLS